MNRSQRAVKIVNDMERVTPYMYEGLYGNFLRSFMDSDQSRWSKDLSRYLSHSHEDWADVGRGNSRGFCGNDFESRISC